MAAKFRGSLLLFQIAFCLFALIGKFKNNYHIYNLINNGNDAQSRSNHTHRRILWLFNTLCSSVGVVWPIVQKILGIFLETVWCTCCNLSCVDWQLVCGVGTILMELHFASFYVCYFVFVWIYIFPNLLKYVSYGLWVWLCWLWLSAST